jgi:hypothetical protein
VSTVRIELPPGNLRMCERRSAIVLRGLHGQGGRAVMTRCRCLSENMNPGQADRSLLSAIAYRPVTICEAGQDIEDLFQKNDKHRSVEGVT